MALAARARRLRLHLPAPAVRRRSVRHYFCSLSQASGLIYAGSQYAADSWRIAEHSNVTAEGPPIYYFKTVIPIAGALVMLQGLAEIVRCIECLRTGAWPVRLEDVEEIDVIDTQLAHSEYVDEESRRIAMESARAIDEAARHRSVMEEGVVHERAIKEDEEKKP
jgi:hypothetical protein